MKVLPLDVIFGLLNDATESGSKEQMKKVLKCLDVIFNSNDGFDLILSESIMKLLRIGLEHPYSEVRLHTLLQLKSKFITNSQAESRRKILVSIYCYISLYRYDILYERCGLCMYILRLKMGCLLQ